MITPEAQYGRYCTALDDTRKFRRLPPSLRTNGTPVIDFSSNDYLGLSQHPAVLEAAYQAGLAYGVGSTGSRLLSGNQGLFEPFEARIAADKQSAAALIFNSGYQANVSVLAALCDRAVLGQQALVFFDRLNHASLYQGIFLSGAAWERYAHGDLTQLNDLLIKYQNDPRPKFIVTETVFGMDGDVADLGFLVSLAAQYQALLYMDEAHATGVLGNCGYGVSTTLSMAHIPHVVIGTFSKGLGGSGAYVACSETIKSYLINKCAGFVYSTALSPMVVAAAAEAWRMVPDFHVERKQLAALGEQLRSLLQQQGFDTGLSSTHIVPVIVKDEAMVLHLKEVLECKYLRVSAIRPPTVPAGTSRLRIAVTCRHQASDIEYLVDAITAAMSAESLR